MLESLSRLPGMPRLLKNIRPLYLLALFQLVGGPVVLMAVMLFGKLSVQHITERGLASGITGTLQSDQWKAATQELAQAVNGLPAKQDERTPVPVQDTKGKLYTTDLDRPASAPVIAAAGRLPWLREDAFAMTRSVAPPGPPPRSV